MTITHLESCSLHRGYYQCDCDPSLHGRDLLAYQQRLALAQRAAAERMAGAIATAKALAELES